MSNSDLKYINIIEFTSALKKLFIALYNFIFVFRAKNINEFLCGLFVSLNIIDIRQENSFKIYEYINSFLKIYLRENNSIPELYLPYEAQPEQTALIKAWKENGGNVIGYIHSTLLTFPGHYIKLHINAPDQLWVHGSSYQKILSLFGWEESKIKKIKSLRYSILKPINIELSTIALPYSTAALDFSISILKNLSKSGVKLRFLRPHPLTGVSKKDLKIINEIITENILLKNLYSTDNAIVCIGPASLPLEILEQKMYCTVIHIPVSKSFIDRFDNSIWNEYIEFINLGEAVVMNLKVNGAFICV
ncbi:hypothetical protein [Silvanigrella aquatica]|uniref:hypothetical protein n=1 Tax=Silvanigrella aquatica TaxID=1915309 RepID=UPI0011E5C24B|nr:hypothetical protein [Silvanigrella aquatica]